MRGERDVGDGECLFVCFFQGPIHMDQFISYTYFIKIIIIIMIVIIILKGRVTSPKTQGPFP